MNESAREIFDYLPISKTQLEDEYITHLWDAFTALDSVENNGRPFAVMTFHLLFMLALQYKVIRIAKEFPEAVELFFSGTAGRSKEQLLNPKRSVFDIALINERTITEVFTLVKLDKQDIKKIKDLIDDRNNRLAHAKGGIEQEPDKKIEQYIEALRILQSCFVPYDDRIASQWQREIDADEDIIEFVDARLLDSQLCPADFQTGKLIKYDMNRLMEEAEDLYVQQQIDIKLGK